MHKKIKKGFWITVVTAPVILLGSIAKGQESSCSKSSPPGDTLTDTTPASGGQPGVFGGAATVTAPPAQSPTLEMPTSASDPLSDLINLLQDALTAGGGVIAGPPDPPTNSTPDEKPKVKECHWVLDKVWVFSARTDDKTRKNLDKLIDKLVETLDAAASEVSAIKKAIDDIGPNDQVDVVIIFDCVDPAGKIVSKKKVEVDQEHNWMWGPKAKFEQGDGEVQRSRWIKQHGPHGNCCP